MGRKEVGGGAAGVVWVAWYGFEEEREGGWGGEGVSSEWLVHY